ncbi:hypothetical protein SUDANB21_02073 [Streptomyces sp. enrichment culture]|uniref:hypothetical protein n=1 Tax=Streptomyces althioticus TaxID=83380 RepID=UPI00344AA102
MTTQPTTETPRRVNVTLSFATDRPTADLGVAVTEAVTRAVPDQLDGVTWHAFTLPADTEQEH